MAELGALSLRIQATGDREVLAALGAIDARARKTSEAALQGASALKALGIGAKASGNSVVVLTADLERATGLLKKMGSTATATTRDMAAAAKREQAANVARAREFEGYITLLSRGASFEQSRSAAVKQLVTLEASLTDALKATNLTLEQQVTIGDQLARVQRGIAIGIGDVNRAQSATAAVATQAGARQTAILQAQTQGMTLFGRQVTNARGQVVGFGRSGLNAFNALAFGMSQMAATGSVSFRSLASSAASALSFFGPGGALAAALTATGLVLVDFFTRSRREIEETRKKAQEEIRALRRTIEEERQTGQQDALIERVQRATRQLTAAERERADIAKVLGPLDARYAEVRRLSSVAAALLKRNEDEETKALRARNDELARSIPLLNAEAKEAAAAAKNIESQRAQGRGELPGRTVEAPNAARIREEREQAIAREIDALATLASARRLSGQELGRLMTLERGLIDELQAGHPTKLREAAIWEQITKARKAASIAVPPVEVRPLMRSTPQAKATLPTPTGAASDLGNAQSFIDGVRGSAQTQFDAAAFADLETEISQSLGNAVAAGIAGGFAQGLGQGGIGEGFKQMAAQLATGLGSVAIDYGLKAQAIAKLMAGISKFLIANPLIAIAAGVALIAAGRAMGGRSGGGVSSSGGGFGGGGSGQDTITRYVFGPGAKIPLEYTPAGLRSTISNLRGLVQSPASAGAATRLSSPTLAPSAPAAPGPVIRVIGHESPEGQRMIGTSHGLWSSRGGV